MACNRPLQTNMSVNGAPATAGNLGEQLDDECQLWQRALRLLSNRQGIELPWNERLSWTLKGVCMPINLSRLARTWLLDLCNESDQRQASIDRLEEAERHARADLRYSQEKMQLYREKLASLQQSSLDSARSSNFLDSVPDSLLLPASVSNASSSNREAELLNSKSVANSRAKALESRACGIPEEAGSESAAAPTSAAAAAADGGSEDLLQAVPGRGYRVTIEQLNRQIASLTDQLQSMESERDLLCTELESRPTNSDHVLLMSKLQRCERLLRRHNIDIGKEASTAAAGRDFSTRVEDIDLLPLSVCQKHLKDSARLLGIEDLKQLREALTDLVSISDAYGIAHPIVAKIQAIVLDDEASQHLLQQHQQQQSVNQSQKSKDRVNLLVPVLEQWRDQLIRLPELQQSLERLFMQLYPWSAVEKLQAAPDTVSLIAAIDRMASDENYELAPTDLNGVASSDSAGASGSQQQPPHSMLLGMVDHFRRLFDVAQLSGVCTKMNSIYTELGVCRNAMNSIKESLGFVEQTPMEAVVSAVDRLMQLERLAVNDKIQEIFSHEDVQLAFDRLEEYDQFFPVFEELVKSLMTVLGVDRIDQILPKVTAHKRVFDSQSGA
uniref:Centrosomal protein of 70 kDa n=1 Tax=Macrostomum lignano TaxID=282301 RepID=A0A1I8GYG5_9PLAT